MQHQEFFKQVWRCVWKKGREMRYNVKFVIVYIEEAHAKDEWAVGQKQSVCNQAKTIEDREQMARELEVKCGLEDETEKGGKISVLLDTMSNEFSKEYGGWPFRFYGMEKGNVVKFVAEPNDRYGYEVENMKDWLELNGWM